MSVSPQGKSLPASPPLPGPAKAALLLLALGKTRAAKVLRRFDAEELKQLSRSALALRPVPLGDLDNLIEEFAQRFATGLNFIGSINDVKSLLDDALASEAPGTALEGAPTGSPGVWEVVAKQQPQALQPYLLREHPQTIAVILSKIGSEPAAAVISILPAGLRNTLLARMLNLKSIEADGLDVLEATLREDFMATATAGGAYAEIANILNRLDKAQCDELIKGLAEKRPDDAKALKRLLFTFAELPLLPAKARGVLLDQVPIERLVLALRGTDAAFQASILSTLASRSKRMVEAELQNPVDVPPAEIAQARRAIVEVVLKMMAKGDVEPPAGEASEEPAG
ncbi:MAG TPA: FliG C-terminal domain-containing protein [Hyphomicrobiaceae bacterium]|jgi:flagellar motor switch protein FliG|nr:FliG C-terminal domain-containing protein [Hyphomicrobiaceae bacterium]